MPRRLDALYWDLEVRTRGLESDVRKAQSRLKGLDKVGEEASDGLREIGQAGSAALNGLARDAKRTGDVLGRSLTASIRASALRIRSEIGGALADGLITPEQARDAGARAARELTREFELKLKDLRGLGRDIDLVDEATVRSEIKELRNAGEQGGREFGDAAARESQSRLKRIEGFIRGGFRAGVVGAMVLVAGQVVRAWRDAAQRIGGLLERAGDVQAIRTAFESLTTARGLDPTSLLDRLQRAARGTASAFDLMRTANEALQAGLPGTERDLARVLEVSRRLGKSVGTDAEESFRRFVQAIIRGRREILDDIGVVVDFDAAHKALATRLGTTVDALTEEQKAAARLEAALAGAEERVRELGEETFTARERVQQLATATRNYVDAILAGIAESPRFTRQLEFMADAALGTADALDQVSIQAGATASTILRTLGNPKVAVALLFLGGPAAVADLVRALSGADTNVDSFTKRLFKLLGVSDEFTKGTEEMTQALEDRNRALDIRRAGTVEELVPIAREVRREVEETNQAFAAGQISREEKERRLIELQKQANLLAAQEARIRERTSEDSPLGDAEEFRRLRAELLATVAGLRDGAEAQRRMELAARGFTDAQIEQIVALDETIARYQRLQQLLSDGVPLSLPVDDVTLLQNRLDAVGIEVVDLIPVAEKLGITLDELATRILDAADASEDMNTELVEMASEYEFLKQTLDAVNDGLDANERRLREEAREWERQISAVARAARGLIDFADALGVVSDDAADTLRAISNLAEGIALIKTDPIGGGLQALGGLAQLGEQLFGESESARRIREAMESNTHALERVRGALDEFADSFDKLAGGVLDAADKIAEIAIAEATDPSQRGTGIEALGQATVLRGDLEAAGISITDIERLGQTAEQPVDQLLRLIAGEDLTFEELRIAVEQFRTLQQEILDVAAAGGTLARELRNIDFRARAFPDAFDTAVERLEAMRDAVLEFGKLPEDLQAEIRALDFTTPEGRAEAEVFFQNLFESVLAGDVRFKDMSREQATEFILDMLEEVRSAAEEGGDVATGPDAIPFEVRRAITEVSANRLIGVLQTNLIHNDRRDALLAQIARALGNGVPSPSAFRAPSIPPVTGLTPSGTAPTLRIDSIEVNVPLEIPPGASPREIVQLLESGIGRRAVEALGPEIQRYLGREYVRDLRSEGRLR